MIAVVLRYKDLVLVVENKHLTEEDNLRYFYNDHTCPSNYLGKAELLVVSPEGAIEDDDPHGLFRYVGSFVIEPTDVEENTCMWSDQGWAKIQEVIK